jgi:hypothetical protein
MSTNRPLTKEEIEKLKYTLTQGVEEIFGRGIPAEDDPDFELYEDTTNFLDGCTTLRDFVEYFKPGEWWCYVRDLDVDNLISEDIKSRAQDGDEQGMEEYAEAFEENYDIDLLI